jgi:hypothetical protein
MNIARTVALRTFSSYLAATTLLMAGHASAQTLEASLQPVAVTVGEGTAATPASSSSLDLSLPDSPGFQRESGYHDVPPAKTVTAPLHAKYIASDEVAQPINGRDKFIIGIKDLYSPLNFVSMIASAGYEQVTNGSPNYGTDRGAFGERLGAAAIRETSQGFLTDSVFSPILHEDPRYYVMGNQHNFFHRTFYAVTRPLITKSDSGKSTVNGALILGYASSSAIAYTYYPKINQNFKDTASDFGGSIGGAALGYFVSEFSDDFFKWIHVKK